MESVNIIESNTSKWKKAISGTSHKSNNHKSANRTSMNFTLQILFILISL